MSARGETLVEVTISILLLAVGALALAAGLTRAGVDRGEAFTASRAAIAAEGWLERWRAGVTVAGDDPGAGSRVVADPPGTLRWSVARTSTCVLEAAVEFEPRAARRRAAVRLSTRRFVHGAGCDG